MKKPIDLIRVAVLMRDLKLPIDPIKSPSLTNAFFVNHMYANLISVNEKNEYEADLAQNFYWQDQTLVIEFADNSIISASDAEFSIKRSFISELNDHSDLWKVLCEENESNTSCLKRISTNMNTLKIEVANKHNLQMVIPILASINYKIVPKSAFDSEDMGKAKIVDYTLTSGKFFIKNNNTQELYPNKSQFKENDSLIEKIQIIDANSETITEHIERKTVDVISTTITLFDKHMDLLKNMSWGLDKTHDIKMTLLIFSRAAILKTTTAERLLIGRSILLEGQNSKAISANITSQYFQNFSQGYLTESQEKIVNSNASAKELSTEITFSAPSLDRWKKALKEIQKLNVVVSEKPNSSLTEVERPDVYVIANDVSFETSYSQISYLYKSGIFKSIDKTADQIINEYLSYENSDDKIKYINKLHFEVISNCYIFPIWSSPYITAVSSEFTSHMSKYNSRTLAWKIKKN